MNILYKASSNSCFLTMRSLSKTASLFSSDRLKNVNIRMYSLAIAREVPKSLSNAVTISNSSNKNINYDRAKSEHDNYLKVIRKYIPVLCLPPLDDLPDSMFVEDTVVAIGNKAVITNPGHISRRNEVDTIRQILQNQLGMNVTDMRDENQNNKEYTTGIATAYCDGGDVLYTGRHLFVGVSGERTNYEAISILQNGLDIEIIPIPFKQRVGALHLKSIITHIDEHTLLVPDNDIGDYVIQTMMNESHSKYDIIRLPNHAILSCNVVSINGEVLIAQLSNHEEDYQTRNILQEVANERNLKLEFVSLNEAAKCDGALTCCSVLLDL
ncbi:MAG: dimethylargininase [Bacillariaceae sp.]|jgi:dimethylargininase